MMTIVVQALSLVIQHWDVIEVVIAAIEGKHLTKDQATKAIQDAMVAAADAETVAKYG